jgi:hypothetical protein
VAALSAQSVATIHLENVVRRVMAVAVQHQRLPIFHGLAKTMPPIRWRITYYRKDELSIFITSNFWAFAMTEITIP